MEQNFALEELFPPGLVFVYDDEFEIISYQDHAEYDHDYYEPDLMG